MKRSIMNRRIIILGILIILLITGCSKRYQVPPLRPEQKIEECSSNINAKIYIDVSQSMVGYVTPGPETKYGKTIETLESVIISGWSKSHVDFFRFGDDIVEIEGREYIHAKETSFYSNSQISWITRIHRVIDQVSDNYLTLVLTDLFQHGGDINLLVQQIKNKCFSQNLAFGIIGIRSEFDGYIYDLGPKQSAFYHRSKDLDENTYRPFYILFMGKYADIARFYDHLKLSSYNFDLRNSIIFSPVLTNNPISLKNAIIDSISSLTEVPDLIVWDQIDPRIKQFRIQGDPPVAVLVVSFPYSATRFTMSFDKNQIETKISAFQCFSDSFCLKPEAVNAVKLSKFEINRDKVTIRLEILPKVLPEDSKEGIYFYEIIFQPKLEAYQIPKWISEWDMENAKGSLMGLNINKAGAYTLNLYRLLGNLWNTNLVVHQPNIGVIYCCLKK